MNITKIQFTNNKKEYVSNTVQNTQKSSNLHTHLSVPDCSVNKNIVPAEVYKAQSLTFCSRVPFVSHQFETTFTKSFFKKLLKEGITDAYSEIELIPREDVDALKSLGVLGRKSQVAVKMLKLYKNQMFPIEKEIFAILENLSKKHPDMTLQELLQLKYPKAEQTLIKQQCNILNKINLISRKLPKHEFLEMRKLLQKSFDKIFEQNPVPEDSFGRKAFLQELKEISISDKRIKERIIKTAETLPQSSNSVTAFIVKYSRPYKLNYNRATKTYTKVPRDSEEIGVRLLEPSIGTDDHIYPQTAYRKEQNKFLENDDITQNTSSFRVTVLTSKRMNEAKADTFLDSFMSGQKKPIAQHIQTHMDRLVQIAHKWSNVGRNSDADLLCDYIKVLQEEFDKRSATLKIDLGDFEKEIPKIKERAAKSNEKKQVKRLKKSGHADNSHGERYVDPSGRVVENRKVQRHSSRFSN